MYCGRGLGAEEDDMVVAVGASLEMACLAALNIDEGGGGGEGRVGSAGSVDHAQPTRGPRFVAPEHPCG